MLLNSVYEQCPNSDPKQCTVTKLGWVHYAHTQNLGHAHTARIVPMSWALLCAQQAGRAHVARTASAGHAHAGRALVATRPGSLPPGRDLTSMSRHQGSQNHVATSNRCRDIEVAKNMSRHHPENSRSRPQNGVATPNLMSPIHPGRDVHFLSRPHADQTRSRPQVISRPQIVFPRSPYVFHVAT